MNEATHPQDPDALRYLEHWQPVLYDAGQRLLGRVATASDHTSAVLDVGAGTGALTFAAARRWPAARIMALDASAAMLSLAQAQAEAGDDERLEWLVADAAAAPVASESIDVVLSAFMLQLVSDRTDVLTDIIRVLRRGGLFGFVTWIAEELMLGADAEFDEAVYDLGLDDPDPAFREPKPGDYESVDEARAELEAVGFGAVDAQAERLSYMWTRHDYLRFKEEYDERELFDSLSAADRARLLERVAQRWDPLPESAFRLEAPLVSVVARRP